MERNTRMFSLVLCVALLIVNVNAVMYCLFYSMLIYDMGATHVTASIAQFYTDDKKETKMKVRS